MERSKTMAHLQRDGFVVVADFLDADRTRKLAESVEHYLTLVPTLPVDAVSFEADGKTIKSLSYLHRHAKYFEELSRDPYLVDFVEEYFGCTSRFLQMQYFAKEARVGSPAPWHQDNA